MSFYAPSVPSTPVQTRKRSPRRSRQFAAAFVALGLVATACGASDEDAATSAASTENVDASSGAAGQTDTTTSDGSGSLVDEDATASTQSGSGTLVADGTRSRLGDQLLASNRSVATGRFEGRISITSTAEVPDGIELNLEGSYDNANQASEVSLDLGAAAMAAAAQQGTDLGPFAAMFEEPMVVRTIDTQAFVSWSLLSLLTGGQGTWIESEADTADDITESFGVATTGSPTEFLEALEDANAEITEIGSEDVRGVSTTHIRAIVDLAELEAGLDADDRSTLERDLGDLSVSAFPIDFWVDDDGLIRRYSMNLDEVSEDGESLGEASLLFEFFDYGADITIAAPPADQIISADELDLSGFDFGN